jgi:hypothetical protein
LHLDLGKDPNTGENHFVSLCFPREALKAFPGYRNRDLPGVKSLLLRIATSENMGSNVKYANTAQDHEWGEPLDGVDLDVYDARA